MLNKKGLIRKGDKKNNERKSRITLILLISEKIQLKRRLLIKHMLRFLFQAFIFNLTQQSGVWVKDTTDVITENIDEAPASETTDVSAMVEDLSAPVMDKGKRKELVKDQASAPKKKRGRPQSHVDGIRIYHKNRGRSERIANMKEKKAFQFDKHGTCSTLDKAFDVDDYFADALLHMPKFAPMFKSLLNNKEKLFDLATTPMNEICSAVILKKLPEKLGDPGKFLIPCDFPKLIKCLALADLGASINLMPLSIWEKPSLPELTHTQMILELADRSTTRSAGIAEGVFVKVGKFYFLTDFVVVDYFVNPRVPLILRRPFLRTERALIDVYGEELFLRVDDEAITFKVGQTSKYSYNDAESINSIDVIDVFCEEYFQEVLGLLKISKSGNPTLVSDSIVAPSSPTLTPFGDSDFLLEETDAFLVIEDDLISPEIDDSYYDSEGEIRLLEKFLNDDPSSPLLPKELKFVEPKTEKSLIDEPPELELKDLPSHLEYAFLEGADKLPVIISKNLKDDENAFLAWIFG
nr:reverse transcriptase domain-containing protein [Tanacetum cinerariifolium]